MFQVKNDVLKGNKHQRKTKKDAQKTLDDAFVIAYKRQLTKNTKRLQLTLSDKLIARPLSENFLAIQLVIM